MPDIAQSFLGRATPYEMSHSLPLRNESEPQAGSGSGSGSFDSSSHSAHLRPSKNKKSVIFSGDTLHKNSDNNTFSQGFPSRQNRPTSSPSSSDQASLQHPPQTSLSEKRMPRDEGDGTGRGSGVVPSGLSGGSKGKPSSQRALNPTPILVHQEKSFLQRQLEQYQTEVVPPHQGSSHDSYLSLGSTPRSTLGSIPSMPNR